MEKANQSPDHVELRKNPYLERTGLTPTEVLPFIENLPPSMKSLVDSSADLSLDRYFTDKDPWYKLGRVITAVGETLDLTQNVAWGSDDREQRKNTLLIAVERALKELNQFEAEFQELSFPDDQTYKDRKRRLLADLYVGCGIIPRPTGEYDRWHHAYIDKVSSYNTGELRSFYETLGVDSQRPIWYNKEALQERILEFADLYRGNPQRHARNAFPVDYPTRLTPHFGLVVNYFYCRMWGSPLGIDVDIMTRPLGDLEDALGYEEIDVARIGLGQPINPQEVLPHFLQEAPQG